MGLFNGNKLINFDKYEKLISLKYRDKFKLHMIFTLYVLKIFNNLFFIFYIEIHNEVPILNHFFPFFRKKGLYFPSYSIYHYTYLVNFLILYNEFYLNNNYKNATSVWLFN